MFRVAPSATSEHKPGAARLIVNPHVLRCLLRPSLTEVPSLGRSYPASSVVRTSPPPQTARPGSRELPVDRELRSPLGLPVLRLIPCVCMLSPLPRQVREPNRSLLIPRRRPSPNFGWVGSCIMVFGACSAFTHVTACRLAKSPSDPLHRRLRRLCYLHRRSDCYRVERSSSRAGLSPAVDQRLFTAHCNRLITPTEDRNVPSQFFQAPSLCRVYCFRATTSSQTEPSLVIVSVRSPDLLRGRCHGVFSHGVAHTDRGVEGSSLSLDIPQRMAARTELLA